MKIADFQFDLPEAPPTDLPEPGKAATTSIVKRFSTVAAATPERVAVADEETAVTYGDLDRRSDRVAAFIVRLGLPRQHPVAVMTRRSRHYLVAVMGVLKAGCAFVPLDPGLPLERRRQMARAAAVPLIVSEAALIGDLHRLQWACPKIADTLCLDTDNIDGLSEPPGSLMSVELWDHLAGDDADDILAGGWKSAFTGRPLSGEVMAAFGENARKKTALLMPPGARVLEIGCASGFTMRHVAPGAGSYVATDLSRRNVERAEAFAVRNGMSHVMGRQLGAHDIDIFEPGSFDLIVMNSVIENFPGFGYLRNVLEKAAELLTPRGAIFLGNVWDYARRDAYLADLGEFARTHGGKGFDTRLDFLEDFFVPEGFFREWAAERGGFRATRSAVAAPGFDPAPYTFDLILQREDRAATGAVRRRHDRRALDPPDTAATLLPATGPGDLAYVLFTSGTTGAPKGVMIEHGAVTNLSQSVQELQLSLLAPAEEALNLSCVAPLAFDGSIVQIFAALLNGHAVHLPDADTRTDPAALHGFAVAHDLDHLDATPSLFDLMLDYWEETGAHCPARMVVLGGEPVPAAMPERFFSFPDHCSAKLVNAYGPTECCVSVAQYLMTSQTFRQMLPPPIGKAIGGLGLELRDSRGRQVPHGIPGEITITGAGVARGYLDDPTLTEARFPTSAAGERWYRSGDIGRCRPDGNIEFIGREDGQVKIRGNRLETGEVETALLSDPMIRRAAVVAVPSGRSGDTVLWAYLVVQPGFGETECRTRLERNLPSYMVPGRLVVVDEIPLTPNGKLDIARLPKPEANRPADPRKPARPLEGDLEYQIAQLMGALLDRTIDDGNADFFALGGHSVLAVQLLSRLNRLTDTPIPLSDLFTCTTVTKLARCIETRKTAPHRESPVLVVNGDGSAVPIVCFHPVGGNVLCYHDLSKELGPDQPIYLVKAQGLEAGQDLPGSVEAMVAAYLPHIRDAVPDGPVRLAGWSFGGLLAFEAAHRLKRLGTDVRGLILLDAVAVPDMVRAFLRKDESEYLADLFSEVGIVDAETLRPLTPEQRLDLLVELGRESEYLPGNADRATMRRLLAVFQNNALAAVHYTPPRLEDFDLLLVRPREKSRAAPGVPGDDYNGWREAAGGKVRLCWMAGSHGTMLRQPNVRELADHIRTYITP